MDSKHEAPEAAAPDAALEARRSFLATCGKFAIATPPAITLILSQTGRSYATASSGGGGGGPGVRVKGNNGFGNGGGDPAPGNSANNNAPNANQKKEDKVR